MNDQAILEKVIVFTDTAHGEQMRKYTPDRYIVHPIRVMNLVREYNTDVTVLSAAILHDVLEDTPVTPEVMRSFLLTVFNATEASRTLELVQELTDVYIKASYPAYNRRRRKTMEAERMAKTSPEAQTIKYADIIDNCREIVRHDVSFARVFLAECKKLLKVMRKGEPALLQKAEELVEQNLKLV